MRDSSILPLALFMIPYYGVLFVTFFFVAYVPLPLEALGVLALLADLLVIIAIWGQIRTWSRRNQAKGKVLLDFGCPKWHEGFASAILVLVAIALIAAVWLLKLAFLPAFVRTQAIVQTPYLLAIGLPGFIIARSRVLITEKGVFGFETAVDWGQIMMYQWEEPKGTRKGPTLRIWAYRARRRGQARLREVTIAVPIHQREPVSTLLQHYAEDATMIESD